jgi:hypothetical protein
MAGERDIRATFVLNVNFLLRSERSKKKPTWLNRLKGNQPRRHTL